MKIATPLIALAAAIVPDLGGRDGGLRGRPHHGLVATAGRCDRRTNAENAETEHWNRRLNAPFSYA